MIWREACKKCNINKTLTTSASLSHSLHGNIHKVGICADLGALNVDDLNSRIKSEKCYENI